jgi:hypothetical protein
MTNKVTNEISEMNKLILKYNLPKQTQEKNIIYIVVHKFFFSLYWNSNSGPLREPHLQPFLV